jgi:hypothetical protein
MEGIPYMKKILATALTSLSIVILMPAASFAAVKQTIVSGTVYLNNTSTTVGSANVLVSCNGHVGNDVSDANDGGYSVTFSAADCPNGSSASVVATKGGLKGSANGGVNKLTSSLNVGIVDVSVVPEFGTIAGIAAIALSGGAFLVVRRKHATEKV